MILSNLSRDLKVVPTFVTFAPGVTDSLGRSKTMLSRNTFQTHFRINVHSVTLSWELTVLYIVMYRIITKINQVELNNYSPELKCIISGPGSGSIIRDHSQIT